MKFHHKMGLTGHVKSAHTDGVVSRIKGLKKSKTKKGDDDDDDDDDDEEDDDDDDEDDD